MEGALLCLGEVDAGVPGGLLVAAALVLPQRLHNQLHGTAFQRNFCCHGGALTQDMTLHFFRVGSPLGPRGLRALRLELLSSPGPSLAGALPCVCPQQRPRPDGQPDLDGVPSQMPHPSHLCSGRFGHLLGLSGGCSCPTVALSYLEFEKLVI